jgi:hypothetical protein
MGTAGHNTRSGVGDNTGNGGVSPFGKTTGIATAMTVTQVAQSSKARGCSTDRSGTPAALLAGCGAYEVRDGPSTRPLSVHPTGSCGSGDTHADCPVRRISASRDNTETDDPERNVTATASRPATSGPTDPNSTASSASIVET